jgi:hypothetical protein
MLPVIAASWALMKKALSPSSRPTGEPWSIPKSKHRGRIVKTTGEGMLVEFASVVDAVRCAVEVQRGMAERNVEVQYLLAAEVAAIGHGLQGNRFAAWLSRYGLRWFSLFSARRARVGRGHDGPHRL